MSITAKGILKLLRKNIVSFKSLLELQATSIHIISLINVIKTLEHRLLQYLPFIDKEAMQGQT